jgi:hypothetical protein
MNYSINQEIVSLYRVYGHLGSFTSERAIAILRERGFAVSEDANAEAIVANALYPWNGDIEKYGSGSPYEAL